MSKWMIILILSAGIVAVGLLACSNESGSKAEDTISGTEGGRNSAGMEDDGNREAQRQRVQRELMRRGAYYEEDDELDEETGMEADLEREVNAHLQSGSDDIILILLHIELDPDGNRADDVNQEENTSYQDSVFASATRELEALGLTITGRNHDTWSARGTADIIQKASANPNVRYLELIRRRHPGEVNN